jgi:hypothetical protein
MVGVDARGKHIVVELASDERLSSAATDVEDATMSRFDDRHNPPRIVRIGGNRQFQPMVI